MDGKKEEWIDIQVARHKERWTDRRRDEWMDQGMDGLMDGPMDGIRDGWMDRRTGRRRDGWKDRQVEGEIDGQICRRTKAKIDEHMDGIIDRSLETEVDGQKQRYSENCQTCRDDEWPNIGRNNCVPKLYDYLMYQDNVALFLHFLAIFCLIVNVFISGAFIKLRDTPIVRANNHNLSFILLISVKLSLLSVFLFSGRPSDLSCKLRQICFGIVFTIAISSVLAKTTLVCISFKAIRPGSSWRKCLGAKVSISMVVLCSFIQVLAGAIWLSTSPPFLEFDMNLYPGKIIIQCNEGSVLAFYFIIGYLGFLAALSFILAFMVRKFPDMFNEAKYITFSMLVFCCVWICAVPAYVSSKGKHAVIVEIFAILTSSAGVGGCIFLPKCYNILMRKNMNMKRQRTQ
ncbi:vomeronasal type-2 receptor 26-like [Gastrophryne carolinensis]